ncbi:PREDICTED: uncharacterized protein LOC105448388 [Wasmannia auropunctata]|uniref:uncharacterized protein LOC105448388 n=1 Tax=Wasmannia auropunctata TaxID=64793 RepID=UPI0005EEB5EA|nr:PREDICTED: uncharacterized protein LOC105448388 [Wasmannia auropunctata]
MSNQRFVVVQFSDGIQVIPKIWLSEDSCKYPLHYKTDLRIRKAVEKEEKPNSDWALFKIIRTFGEYCTLQEADNKAKKLCTRQIWIRQKRKQDILEKIERKKFISQLKAKKTLPKAKFYHLLHVLLQNESINNSIIFIY